MLNLWGATALVTGGMVGAGILVLPSLMAQFGSWSIFGWVLASFMAFSIAVIFGRLSQIFKDGYGPAFYIYKTFGEIPGFLAGWGHFIGLCAGTAAVAQALGSYAFPLIGIESFSPTFFGLICLVAIFLINIFNASTSVSILMILTFLKVSFLLILACFAVPYSFSYNYSFGPIGDVFSSASLAMFAFLGLEFATVPGSKVENPERNIMLATKMGVSFAALCFFGAHCAVLFSLPDASASSRPVYDAAVVLLGHNGAFWVSVVATLGCIGSLNGLLMVVSFVIKNAADQKWISPLLARSTASGFPWVGGLICLFFVLLFSFDSSLKIYLCYATNSLLGLPYFLASLADIKYRGFDKFNIFAIFSSLLLIWPRNLYMLVLLAFIYLLGISLRLFIKPSLTVSNMGD